MPPPSWLMPIQAVIVLFGLIRWIRLRGITIQSIYFRGVFCCFFRYSLFRGIDKSSYGLLYHPHHDWSRLGAPANLPLWFWSPVLVKSKKSGIQKHRDTAHIYAKFTYTYLFALIFILAYAALLETPTSWAENFLSFRPVTYAPPESVKVADPIPITKFVKIFNTNTKWDEHEGSDSVGICSSLRGCPTDTGFATPRWP